MRTNQILPNKMMTAAALREANPSIPEFYKQRSVFITGGTGFIGKVKNNLAI